MNRLPASSFRHRSRQRGAVLIIALLVLVATVLAAVAVVRSVDVATLISGNLAFRQTGVQAADSGVEAARQWLMAQPIDSLNVSIGPRYFATSNGGVVTTIPVFDPATFNWSANSFALPAERGNTAQYVVHRMCETPGDPKLAATRCFTAGTTSSGGTSNRIKEPGDVPCFDPNTGANLCGVAIHPYYRITVKVTGPRGTVTYVQGVIY